MQIFLRVFQNSLLITPEKQHNEVVSSSFFKVIIKK
jgi:hypothetical protein